MLQNIVFPRRTESAGIAACYKINRQTTHACVIIPRHVCMHARRCAFKMFAQSLGVHCRRTAGRGGGSRPLRRLARRERDAHVRCTVRCRVPRNRDGTGNELSVDYTSGQSYARKVITKWPPPAWPRNVMLKRVRGIS